MPYPELAGHVQGSSWDPLSPLCSRHCLDPCHASQPECLQSIACILKARSMPLESLSQAARPEMYSIDNKQEQQSPNKLVLLVLCIPTFARLIINFIPFTCTKQECKAQVGVCDVFLGHQIRTIDCLVCVKSSWLWMPRPTSI